MGARIIVASIALLLAAVVAQSRSEVEHDKADQASHEPAQTKPPSRPAPPAPVKPFHPTEKIRPGSTVSFPTDI